MTEASEGEKKRSYTTIGLPLNLAYRIDKLIESERGGYVSRTDFVLDAVRRRLKDFDMIE
jgi:metal-responsive CopG/Arc/MetJ family transcriptional regulator